MQAEAFGTPILLIIFNRPRTTRRVFEAIARIRPAKLLVVADAPRPGKAGEAELCTEAREIVSAVDWPCEVLTNFAEKNLGCQERIISGLNWAFSLVEEAIILEDDCLPDLSFFPFCHEMLDRYRGDSRVASISGTNLLERHLKSPASYFFSQLGGNWGWATWKTEWLRYDRQLKNWIEIKRSGTLSEVFEDPKAMAYWTLIFDQMYENSGANAWDYQWLYTHLINNALTIIPRVNLVANIGFGPDATHTSNEDSRLTPSAKSIAFPLKHPSNFIPLRSMDRRVQKLFYLPYPQRLAGIVRRILKKIVQPFPEKPAE